jgi:hypothetical protein
MSLERHQMKGIPETRRGHYIWYLCLYYTFLLFSCAVNASSFVHF